MVKCCCHLATRGGDHPFFNLVHVHNKGRCFQLPGGSGRLAALVLRRAGVRHLWPADPPAAQAVGHPALERYRLQPDHRRALGNVFDRLVLGVVDFLDFYWHRAHWPAFNLADSFIFIGAAMIVLDVFVARKRDALPMSQLIVADSSVLFHFHQTGRWLGGRQHGAARQACPSADGRRQPDAELRAMPAGGCAKGRARALPWRRKRRSAFPIPTTSTISIAPNSVTKLSPRWYHHSV